MEWNSLKSLILCIVLLFSSPSEGCNEINSKNNIYKPYTQFLFEVKYDSGTTTRTEYILMKVTNETRHKETAISYFYFHKMPDTSKLRVDFAYDDSTKRYSFVEYTQLTDNDRYIWIHPPRSLYRSLADYYPFPEIFIPVKSGTNFKRGGIRFNDPLSNSRFLFILFKVNIGIAEKYIYQEKEIDVYRISGVAKSKIGKQTFYFLFHPVLGFVEWCYNLNNDVRLKLTQIKCPYL